MTERLSSISTQIATPLQTTFNPPVFSNDATSATETVDDSTIKCICGFSDDDGSTIFCENCSTWQHIECFYPGRTDEFDDQFEHHCADCKPRTLDVRLAHERQRSQLENKGFGDLNDKKSKRTQSKSHKKKAKLSDVQINGFHDSDRQRNGSPQDHPYTKKSKGHRSTQSVSSQLKRSPPYNARPNSNHPPSPAHTPPDLPPDFVVHTFSETFEHLYDNHNSFQQTSRNTFTRDIVINTTAEWLRNPDKLRQDTGIDDEKELFDRLTEDPKILHFPELRVEEREVSRNDTSHRYRSLFARTSIKNGNIIGELNGLVGFQKDYTNEPTSQWQDIPHAKPFVFFPSSRLPLYIDARSEGSDCRYARRSCRPNAQLETFIAHGADYHFWLISERQINPGEQITVAWDIRFPPHLKKRYMQLLHLGDGDPSDGSDMTEADYIELSNLTFTLLSDYGGCACELGNDCAFVRFHRDYHGRLQHQSNGTKTKKARKAKQNHVSPTSTGHATNSRAASEGQQDQYDEDDSRSVSGSVRSKPHSRDMTPIHDVGANGILTEPSDREKRKLAALEATFQKMEQVQPPRKKKRTSEGSTISGTVSSMTPQPQSKPRQKSVVPRAPTSQLANGSRTSKYVDASTSRRESHSPTAGSPPGGGPSPGQVSQSGSVAYRSRQVSMIPKTSYTDSSTQTEVVHGAWWSPPSNPRPKRSVSCLSKRLLKNRLKLQPQIEARRATLAGIDDAGMLGSPTLSMDLDGSGHDDPSSPVESRGRNASIASSTPSVDTSADVNMTDAPSITVGNSIKPPPPPWPGQSNSTARSNSISGYRSPDLRVQMPAVPSFTAPNMAGTPTGNATPTSATASIVQSPFGTTFPNTFAPPSVNGAVQSPAKGPKKLSLSDYKARQAKKEEKKLDGSSPTITPAVLKPSLSTIEEAKAAEILEESAIVDTPVAEKSLDPMSSIAGPSTTGKENMPLQTLPNGTL